MLMYPDARRWEFSEALRQRFYGRAVSSSTRATVKSRRTISRNSLPTATGGPAPRQRRRRRVDPEKLTSLNIAQP